MGIATFKRGSKGSIMAAIVGVGVGVAVGLGAAVVGVAVALGAAVGCGAVVGAAVGGGAVVAAAVARGAAVGAGVASSPPQPGTTTVNRSKPKSATIALTEMNLTNFTIITTFMKSLYGDEIRRYLAK